MVMKCLETDLGAIFASSEFGEAEFSASLNGVPLKFGIFDDEDVEIALGEGVGQIVPQPKFTCPSSQVPSIAAEQPMVIRGRDFTVKHWKNNGVGEITIYLESVA